MSSPPQPEPSSRRSSHSSSPTSASSSGTDLPKMTFNPNPVPITSRRPSVRLTRLATSPQSPRSTDDVRSPLLKWVVESPAATLFSPLSAFSHYKGVRCFGLSLARRVQLALVVFLVFVCVMGSVSVLLKGPGLRDDAAANELVDPEVAAARLRALPLCDASLGNTTSHRELVFDLKRSRRLRRIHAHRVFRARGFEFCPILNNSTFDGLAFVNPLNGSLMAVNPRMAEFVKMVDDAAEAAHKGLMERNRFLNAQHAKRYSCFQAADGFNSFANLSTSQLLHQLDPTSYHLPVLPALLPQKSQIVGRRRRYRMAYLVTAHGGTEMLDNLKLLVNTLDDGSAVFLVHVDLRYAELEAAIKAWLFEREEKINEIRDRRKLYPGRGNVFLARNRYAVVWGHVSMVYMQLSGAWELVDLADWDFWINISLEDFPLRKSRELHRVLTAKEFVGRNFISFELETTHSATRLPRPHIARGDNLTAVPFDHGPYSPPDAGFLYHPFDGWKSCVNPQWMVLSRAFLEHLRTSRAALEALAFFEFTYIPDQSFFCQVILNDPTFSNTIVNDMKRFLDFRYDRSKTEMLTLDHRHLIGYQFFTSQEPKYFFVRKVNPRSDEGKALVGWIRRYHLDRHVMADEVYGVVEEKEWAGPQEDADGPVNK
ncbi:hypothetical protein HDU96_005536 [Phlyctochytrium bullatum]|nr:hypothetical protein HDU96_005536 [Phlyctochytrium bullatum]